MLSLLAAMVQAFLDLLSLTTGRSVQHAIQSTRNQELLTLHLLIRASGQVLSLLLT